MHGEQNLPRRASHADFLQHIGIIRDKSPVHDDFNVIELPRVEGMEVSKAQIIVMANGLIPPHCSLLNAVMRYAHPAADVVPVNHQELPALNGRQLVEVVRDMEFDVGRVLESDFQETISHIIPVGRGGGELAVSPVIAPDAVDVDFLKFRGKDLQGFGHIRYNRPEELVFNSAFQFVQTDQRSHAFVLDEVA